jgi:farnesyl-diphosphate farnesyltransferase
LLISKKQGAYGRLKTHKESTLSQLLHVDEVFAAISLLYINPLQSNLHSDHVRNQFQKNALQDDLSFCDEILVKVSRSFAAVIQQLPAIMLVDVLIFYLVLRALDTIEDDTKAFAGAQGGDDGKNTKVELLLNFHKSALTDPTWSLDGVGEGDERRLLQEFPKCCRVYSALSAASQAVISDITQRMAAGMAEFVDKDLGQGTQDVEQYNRYCHFVAGLVGEGLSRLFAVSGLEDESLGKEVELSDQMGLFLQKTNIIRDYLEDYVDKRAFWPRTIWSKYSVTGDLGYFANQANINVQTMSLQCLNELVTDALELVPDCLDYLSKLQCLEIFRFCAIPQVMAIATLDKCYNNLDVFTGVVKIRKGLSCKLIVRTNNLMQVHETFHQFARSILSKARRQREKGDVADPSYEHTVKICTTILSLTQNSADQQHQARTKRRLVRTGFLMAAALVPHIMPSAESSNSSRSRLESSKTAIQVRLTAMAIVAPWLVGQQHQARTKRRLVRTGFLMAAALVPYIMPSAESSNSSRLESSKTAIQVGLTAMAIVAPWLVGQY